jgi:YCII-related domain
MFLVDSGAPRSSFIRPPTEGATVSTYVFTYKGGSMPQTDAERAQVMDAWRGWLGGMGDTLVDGGNPFGPSATVAPGGAVSQGSSSGLSGYSIIAAASLDAASAVAKGCPVLAAGGSVEVYEVFAAM